MLLSDTMHRVGALNMAGIVLDGLLAADGSLNDVQRGRIISQRARVYRKKWDCLEEGLEHDRDGRTPRPSRQERGVCACAVRSASPRERRCAGTIPSSIATRRAPGEWPTAPECASSRATPTSVS